jgi:hypothetical protein
MTPITFVPNTLGKAGAVYHMMTSDKWYARFTRAFVPGATGARSAWNLISSAWKNRNGKATSVVQEYMGHASLLNNQLRLVTESSVEQIDSSETSTIFSLKDLQARAAALRTTTDNTRTKVASDHERFMITGNKPFIAVPFILLAENGATWSTLDGTHTDPKEAIDAALGDVEHRLSFLDEINSKLVMDGGVDRFLGAFDIDCGEALNMLLDKYYQFAFSEIDSVPECFLGMFVTSNEDDLNIYQWSAEQSFSNRIGL